MRALGGADFFCGLGPRVYVPWGALGRIHLLEHVDLIRSGG